MSFYSNNIAAGVAAKTISSQAKSIQGSNMQASCRLSHKEQKENLNPLHVMQKSESN